MPAAKAAREPPADADTFLAVTDTIAELSDLERLEAGLLAGLHLGLASDTRSFARIFGVEHALVLRALETLVGTDGLLTVVTRDARTQRTRYAASEAGEIVLANLARGR